MMKQFLRKLFLRQTGGLRAGWKMFLGALVCSVVFSVVLNGLGGVFGALFEAWGLTTANLNRAPAWAQRIVRGHTDFCYLLAYAAMAAAGFLLAGRWNGCGLEFRRKAAAAALLVGTFMGAGLALFSLRTDCVRPELPLSEPTLSIAQLSTLAVIFVGKISAEVLTKRIVFDSVRERRWCAYFAAAVAALLLSGTLFNGVGAVNVLLMSIAGCALYERGGLLASAALTAMWTVWTTLIFGFPGLTRSTVPVWSLYHVSDAWLTGGNFGPECGIWMTLTLIAAIMVLMKKDISAFFKRMRLGKARKKEAVRH